MVEINTCGCTGDTYLRLLDSLGNLVALNDDSGDNACGYLCSRLSYVVPIDAACFTFSLHQGCYADSSCSGTSTVAVQGDAYDDICRVCNCSSCCMHDPVTVLCDV